MEAFWKNKSMLQAALWRCGNSEETYISRILKKIWPSGDATSEKVAYAIAVCQTMLDSNYEKITMSDTAVKNRAARNLVNIYNYFYYYFLK